MSEMSCPLKNSWKLRWRRAREAICQRDSRAGASSPALSAGLARLGSLTQPLRFLWMTITALQTNYNLNVLSHSSIDGGITVQASGGKSRVSSAASYGHEFLTSQSGRTALQLAFAFLPAIP